MARRTMPKITSHRYEIDEAVGPVEAPLIAPGSAIIETRYRGRSVSWTMSMSPLSTQTWTVDGTYATTEPDKAS